MTPTTIAFPRVLQNGQMASALEPKPDWMTTLIEAFSSRPLFRSLPDALREQSMGKQLTVIEPLISHGRERLQRTVDALSRVRVELPFDPVTVENLLFPDLPRRLLQMLSRTLVLELNVARLKGELRGDTPAHRYSCFLKQMSAPMRALEFLLEYPVLAHQLVTAIEQWVTTGAEFLQRLCEDWELLKLRFGAGKNPGVLTEVDGGAGDRHQGGRSVMIGRFSSGLHIVYKPRSMAVDAHFQDLLNWLNEQTTQVPFRTVDIVDRGSYGWMEFVHFEACDSETDVKHFYQRLGGLLAVLYALNACDFHCDNVIAAGEHPVLLDLEALFHPRIGQADSSSARKTSNLKLASSVLAVGLLPQRAWSNTASEGIDLSGLGSASGQLTPHAVLHWEEVDTDQMRFGRKRVTMPASRNRPRLKDQEPDLLNYSDALVSGFESIYRVMLGRREEMLGADGPLAAFARDEVRVIVRPTRTYAILLQESYHPDCLRDPATRARLFDALWGTVEWQPALGKLCDAERDELQNGDIPSFRTLPTSLTLYSGANTQIAEAIAETGMTLAERKVRLLSAEDLSFQLWVIRASIATTAPASARTAAITYELSPHQHTLDRDVFIAAAREVGDRLESLALWHGNEASWIGLTMAGERVWSLTPLGMDLYDGLPGVALFLAHLGAVTHDRKYTALAAAALAALRHDVEESGSWLTTIGAFGGWGGVIYALTHFGLLWRDRALVEEAERIVDRLLGLIESDEHLDFVSGSAGCILALAALRRVATSATRIDVALERCGERLLASARAMEPGLGWVGKTSEEALTGLSHGAAGIGWALLQLAELSGQRRFRSAGLAAIEYERSLFVRAAGNWNDLRYYGGDREPSCMLSWCHGAPGIGLARLGSLPYLSGPEVEREIEAAVDTTIRKGFGSNHSLCHGDLGNLDLLLQAAEAFQNPRWRARSQEIAAMIVHSIRRDGYLSGVPLGTETPGLMTGLAGIGLGLLRAADPIRVPSVLSLALPQEAGL